LLFSGVSEAMDIPLQLRQNLPVKLPTNATIAPEKLTAYLLVRQARGDKSAFLAKAGYTAANPEQLLHDLRRLSTLKGGDPDWTNKVRRAL